MSYEINNKATFTFHELESDPQMAQNVLEQNDKLHFVFATLHEDLMNSIQMMGTRTYVPLNVQRKPRSIEYEVKLLQGQTREG